WVKVESTTPAFLLPFDVDGDGRMDISVSGRGVGSASTVSILYQGNAESYSDPEVYTFGPAILGHRFADMNRDGTLDLVVFFAESVSIQIGRAACRERGEHDE